MLVMHRNQAKKVWLCGSSVCRIDNIASFRGTEGRGIKDPRPLSQKRVMAFGQSYDACNR